MGLKQETENRCLCVWGTAAAYNMCGFVWVLRFLYHQVEEEGGCESLNVVSALTTAQKSRIRIRMIPWAKHHGVTWRPGDPEICAVSILYLIMQGRDKKVKVCWVPLALLDHIASSHWLAVLGTHPVTGTWGGFYWGRDQYRVIMGHPRAQLSCLRSGAGALGLLFRKTNPTSIIGRDIIPFTGRINFTTGPTKPSILYYFLYKRWNKTFLHKD